MNKESITCRGCPTEKLCHPNLMPEKLHYANVLGKFIGLSTNLEEKKGFINCRHYSCNDGRVAAWNAMGFVDEDDDNV